MITWKEWIVGYIIYFKDFYVSFFLSDWEERTEGKLKLSTIYKVINKKISETTIDSVSVWSNYRLTNYIAIFSIPGCSAMCFKYKYIKTGLFRFMCGKQVK